MATLHGKKLTEKQHIALVKKWENDDKKFWKKHHRLEIDRLKKQLSQWTKKAADTKKRTGSALGVQLTAIARAKAEIKSLQTKLKNL